MNNSNNNRNFRPTPNPLNDLKDFQRSQFIKAKESLAKKVVKMQSRLQDIDSLIAKERAELAELEKQLADMTEWERHM